MNPWAPKQAKCSLLFCYTKHVVDGQAKIFVVCWLKILKIDHTEDQDWYLTRVYQNFCGHKPNPAVKVGSQPAHGHRERQTSIHTHLQTIKSCRELSTIHCTTHRSRLNWVWPTHFKQSLGSVIYDIHISVLYSKWSSVSDLPRNENSQSLASYTCCTFMERMLKKHSSENCDSWPKPPARCWCHPTGGCPVFQEYKIQP